MDDRRRTVDDSVRFAGEVLAACASHIREGRQLADWAPHEREALLAACFSPPHGDEIERRKAENLAWHLFRRSSFRPAQPVWNGGVVSERIRADLPGLVRLGSGRYLLRSFEHRDESDRNGVRVAYVTAIDPADTPPQSPYPAG